MTPGQVHDSQRALALLASHEPKHVIADKGYDSDEIIENIERRGSKAVIPSRKLRKQAKRLDRRRYRQRNLVERFVNQIKHFRRIATRYEKTARNFLGFIHLAALCCWIN